MRTRTRRVDIPFATFLRALAALALVWAWWHLWQWVLVFVLAAFLAVALDPAVQWLERRGLRRPYGAVLMAALLLVVLGGLIAISGASLAEEARIAGNRIGEFRESLMSRIPPELRRAGTSIAPSDESMTNAARALARGIGGILVALVVTLYLLLDGRRTYQWLVALVPERNRPRMHETAARARVVVAGYIRGNLITSVLCAIFTWIALLAMGVPAALVLALLAGILDLVPVIGFILSAAPAIVLALTVSPAVALGVAAFYVAYNVVENYYIAPKVYGRELQLSDLAVIAAFLVGAELGGVLGALIALPLAAMYPIVEELWFDRPGVSDPADEHRRIAAQSEH